MSLQGKRLLVIGGGSGIGKAIAAGALREGASVVVASTNAEKVAATAVELGAGAAAATLDVTNEAGVADYFAGAGGFDHIAFTAGDWAMPPPGPMTELDLGRAASMLNVRFWGAVAVAKHGAASLPAGGSFTVTGGMLAHQPMKGRPLWTAGAGAIEFLARGLAVDLAPIRVNCVCPGLIETEQWANFPPPYRAALLEMASHQLLPRPGTPDEAAQAYLYLMGNAFATGQVLYVEGGGALSR